MKEVLLNTMCLILIFMAENVYASNDDPTKSDIIFDHEIHSDLECIDCHGDAIGSNKSDDRLFPEMEFCGDCHDIEDPDDCTVCHRNGDEPEASPDPVRNILFSHKKHYDLEIDCLNCHNFPARVTIPGKPFCMDCHDGHSAKNDCQSCHGDNYSLLDIHPLNWRDQHGSQAILNEEFCISCHRSESFCIDCHQGDNTDGAIHNLNYRYTHALDAGGKEINCYNCHDNRTFCNECHLSENRMPLEHSTLGWINEHGSAARNNVENCASCHDSSDPNCARIGCHSDKDGLRGTDPPIHAIIHDSQDDSWQLIQNSSLRIA